jgi:hypothetical protein
MPDREPTSTTNLDRYGDAALEWTRARDALIKASGPEHQTWFLGTTRPDGRPHAAGVGAMWHADDVYFTTSPDARKGRNLASKPNCTISASLDGIDLVIEGEAIRVTDGPTLERLAAIFRDTGWPAQVENEAFTAPFSAPSAGPPPWYVYRVSPRTIFGVATAEPNGATRWRFDD